MSYEQSGGEMAEVLVRFVASVTGADGTKYVPQACGGVAADGLWEGWIEFVSGDSAVRTARETEQPSRDALMYWAQGLTDTYLEGALARATRPRTVVPREPLLTPRFGEPARPHPRPVRPSRAVLDPFAMYNQGEDLLRGQLEALSHDNLVAIVEDYALPIYGADDMRSRTLTERILAAVRTAYAGSRDSRPSSQAAQRPEAPNRSD